MKAISRIVTVAKNSIDQSLRGRFQKGFQKFKRSDIKMNEKLSEKTMQLMYLDFWEEDMPTLEIDIDDLELTNQNEITELCMQLKQQTSKIEYTSHNGNCTCFFNVFKEVDHLKDRNIIELEISKEFLITIGE